MYIIVYFAHGIPLFRTCSCIDILDLICQARRQSTRANDVSLNLVGHSHVQMLVYLLLMSGMNLEPPLL